MNTRCSRSKSALGQRLARGYTLAHLIRLVGWPKDVKLLLLHLQSCTLVPVCVHVAVGVSGHMSPCVI